jgi:hypothetical protein
MCMLLDSCLRHLCIFNIGPHVMSAHLLTMAMCHTVNTIWYARAGVDMLVDVHGDEELPYCFIAGSEGIPGWGERMQMMQVSPLAVLQSAQCSAAMGLLRCCNEPGSAAMKCKCRTTSLCGGGQGVNPARASSSW